MKCNWEWLSAYLDGALAEDKRAKLEEHLKTCEACSAKLEEFARVEQTAKKIPAPQLSEAYWENFASRVQNKLTIREKQRTAPAWLEALKGFFQPTTGKLAIAGSVAVILLLTFISLDQWKKQTFRPPVFEAEKPVAEGKVDSVQVTAKDESEFRTTEKDNKAGHIEDKRHNQPTPEKGTAALFQKPTENRPAASPPLGRALAAPEEQQSKEEPSLAAYADRDVAVEGDTVLATAGKKAENRKEVAASSTKGISEKAKNVPVRNLEDLLKIQVRATPPGEWDFGWRRRATPESGSVSTTPPTAKTNQSIPGTDTVAKPSAPTKSIEEFSLIKGGFDAQYGGKAMPAIDTVQLVADIRLIIIEKERQLKEGISKSEIESLYVYLGQYYVQLYRFSLDAEDWKKADRRLTDFLKTDLSESNRRWLAAIQDELKKLKK